MFAVNFSDVAVTLEVVEQPAPNGDLDFNGRVDLADFAMFQNCFSGPGGSVAPCCEPGNFNGDDTIDLTDYAVFRNALSGP